MPFFLLVIFVKVALTVAGVTIFALLIAEFFPVLADKAIALASGTEAEPIARWVAKGLNYCAKYANIVVNFVFDCLGAVGIDIQRSEVEGELKALENEAQKIDAPRF